MKKIAINSMRVFLSMVCMVTVVGCSAIFSGIAAKEKTFTKSGMSIVLNENFYEKEYVAYTAYYESSQMLILVLKDDFSNFSSQQYNVNSVGTKKYAELVVEGNNLNEKNVSEIITEDDLTYFTYENSSNGKDFTYFAVSYKSDDAFWLIQFCCEQNNYENLKPTMLQYAHSVTFDNAE